MTLNDGIEYVYAIFRKISSMIFSILSLVSTQIILNPYGTFKQKDFFLLKDDAVVVNLLPSQSYKFMRDLFNYFKYFFTGKICAHQTISDERFKFIYNELNKMVQGESKLNGFQGKNFEKNAFYFKGYEYLTSAQKTQLSEYGPDIERKIKFFNVESSHGAILDTLEYDAGSRSSENQHYMICCNPRDVNYSLYLQDGFLEKISSESGSKVIAFNYRGIDRSQGLILTEEDVILDTIAQVKRLLNDGVDSKSITLYGYCLGGVIATLVAASLKKEGIEVRLYNDRSFLSTSKFVIGIICPEKVNNPIACVRWILGIIFYPIIWLIVRLGGWQMDAQSAWKSIDENNKTYSVVKSVENHVLKQKDGVINTSLASISSIYLNQKQANSRCYSFDRNLNQKSFFKDGHFLKSWQLENEAGTVLSDIASFLCSACP